MTQRAKSLSDPQRCAERSERIGDPHIAPLTAFTETLRRTLDLGTEVPYPDPADGGVEADCLIVLESPARRAVQTGFVSRDNPDDTAKNLFELTAEAGLPRHRTVIWNIVPWRVGRKANFHEIDEGWSWLRRFIALLPKLRIVVLSGSKSQLIAPKLNEDRPDLAIVHCPHPTPQFVDRDPNNRSILISALREAANAMR